MLDLATWIIAFAAAAGSLLAAGRLRPAGPMARPRALVASHLVLALGGYGLLVAALRGPARGAGAGTQSFGLVAAVALALAALLGLVMFTLAGRGRRVPALLVGVHATLAVSGFVVLAVYALET
jgi:hypothetical protein